MPGVWQHCLAEKVRTRARGRELDLAERACGPVTGHWPKDRTRPHFESGSF